MFPACFLPWSSAALVLINPSTNTLDVSLQEYYANLRLLDLSIALLRGSSAASHRPIWQLGIVYHQAPMTTQLRAGPATLKSDLEIIAPTSSPFLA